MTCKEGHMLGIVLFLKSSWYHVLHVVPIIHSKQFNIHVPHKLLYKTQLQQSFYLNYKM